MGPFFVNGNNFPYFKYREKIDLNSVGGGGGVLMTTVTISFGRTDCLPFRFLMIPLNYDKL